MTEGSSSERSGREPDLKKRNTLKTLGALALGGVALGQFKDSKDDALEMKEVLDAVLESFPETPIYIIPGNHETKKSYTDVINQFKQNNQNSKVLFAKFAARFYVS